MIKQSPTTPRGRGLMKTPRRGLGLGVYHINVLQNPHNSLFPTLFDIPVASKVSKQKYYVEACCPHQHGKINKSLSFSTIRFCGVKISRRKSRTFRVARAEPEV